MRESQDWDARAAQEVAAARARGADLGALLDRKQHRAVFLRSKAERKQAEASSEPHAPGLVEAADVAQAEVPSQHLCAFLGVAPVLSLGFYREGECALSMVFPLREDVTAARGSRLATAAGVDDSGKLSIIAALLSQSPAAARFWQQVPSEDMNRSIDLESLFHLSCPYESTVTIVVVGVLCLLLALLAGTLSAILRPIFVLQGRSFML